MIHTDTLDLSNLLPRLRYHKSERHLCHLPKTKERMMTCMRLHIIRPLRCPLVHNSHLCLLKEQSLHHRHQNEQHPHHLISQIYICWLVD